tara:strand:- start:305 stop:601 length:297 start_codon:yes stop_codon:yes gene_type:complete
VRARASADSDGVSGGDDADTSSDDEASVGGTSGDRGADGDANGSGARADAPKRVVRAAESSHPPTDSTTESDSSNCRSVSDRGTCIPSKEVVSDLGRV